MSLSLTDARQAKDMMDSAETIHCVCHRNPDGDAIGSVLGLALLLESVFPEKTVHVNCTDPAPETFAFLPGVGRLQEPTITKGSLVIFVDCGEPKQTGLDQLHPELFDGTHQTINIDHHATNTNFAKLNFVLPDASSACEVIVLLAEALDWKLSADIATCLLTGVYTDTGGMLHSNTTSAVYRTVARLLRDGARQPQIVKEVFRTSKLSTLKLWGRVLEKISLTDEGGAISALTQGDFRATGAHHSELTGAIDYVNAIPGMRFSLILSERDGGVVKGSLRTLRDDVDVAKMASKFSGGGHKKAAGFSLPGKLQPEVRWKVVPDEQG